MFAYLEIPAYTNADLTAREMDCFCLLVARIIVRPAEGGGAWERGTALESVTCRISVH